MKEPCAVPFVNQDVPARFVIQSEHDERIFLIYGKIALYKRLTIIIVFRLLAAVAPNHTKSLLHSLERKTIL